MIKRGLRKDGTPYYQNEDGRFVSKTEYLKQFRFKELPEGVKLTRKEKLSRSSLNRLRSKGKYLSSMENYRTMEYLEEKNFDMSSLIDADIYKTFGVELINRVERQVLVKWKAFHSGEDAVLFFVENYYSVGFRFKLYNGRTLIDSGIEGIEMLGDIVFSDMQEFFSEGVENVIALVVMKIHFDIVTVNINGIEYITS